MKSEHPGPMAGFEPHATEITTIMLRLEHRLSNVQAGKPTKISTLKNRLFKKETSFHFFASNQKMK